VKLHLRCGKMLSIKPRKYFTMYGELFAVHRRLTMSHKPSKTKWITSHYPTGACINCSENETMDYCISSARAILSSFGKRKVIKTIKAMPIINTRKKYD
jgi:hypothetical protein